MKAASLKRSATLQAIELPARLLGSDSEHTNSSDEPIRFGATKQIRHLVDALEDSDIDLSEASSAEGITRVLVDRLSRRGPRALAD